MKILSIPECQLSMPHFRFSHIQRRSAPRKKAVVLTGYMKEHEPSDDSRVPAKTCNVRA